MRLKPIRQTRHIGLLALVVAVASTTGCGTSTKKSADASGKTLVGLFAITDGACDTGAPKGSFFRMVQPGGTPAAGPFVVNGDYLILATREDLLAGALQLMEGSKERTIEAEQWWSQSSPSA